MSAGTQNIPKALVYELNNIWTVFAGHQIVRHRQQCMTTGLLRSSATSDIYGGVDSYMLHEPYQPGHMHPSPQVSKKRLHVC